MLSLKVIAEQLGVSNATVSNALNNKGKVSPALRQRIIKLAKQAGYQISPHALALQGRRLNILGLMMTSIDDGMAQQFFLGTDRAAQERDYSTILAVTSHEGMDIAGMELRSVDRFDLLRIGGVLYLPAADTEHLKVETILRKRHIPFVLLYRRRRNDKSPAVTVDHAQGYRLGLDHLLALGHRKIGIVYDPLYRGPELDIARQIFAEKLPRLPAEEWVFGFDPGSLQKRLKRQATAFLALSDSIAWLMAEELKGRGLNVPGDVSLIGFRDTLVARSMSPKLTTLHVPAQEMGYAAGKWLVQQIEDMNSKRQASPSEVPPINECAPPVLVVRESTAPPPVRATTSPAE